MDLGRRGRIKIEGHRLVPYLPDISRACRHATAIYIGTLTP
jgi:hypothetical protein